MNDLHILLIILKCYTPISINDYLKNIAPQYSLAMKRLAE